MTVSVNNRVFVYGTLLKGLERQGCMEDSEYLGPALLEADLHDLGAYPGIRKGDGNVIGELYLVNEQVLRRLDDIEGYTGDDSDSLFTREKVIVRLFATGEQSAALTYFYNSPPNNLVTHGDYRRHRLQQDGEKAWILVYGSNLSRERLFRRVGNVSEFKKGHVEGFRLAFNKQASNGREVYANIVWQGDNARCPAIACQLDPEQIGHLDSYEGVPSHYLRVTVPFTDESGEVILTQMYIAHPNQISSDLGPGDDYVDHIRTGYEEHGFDMTHLEEALK